MPRITLQQLKDYRCREELIIKLEDTLSNYREELSDLKRTVELLDQQLDRANIIKDAKRDEVVKLRVENRNLRYMVRQREAELRWYKATTESRPEEIQGISRNTLEELIGSFIWSSPIHAANSTRNAEWERGWNLSPSREAGSSEESAPHAYSPRNDEEVNPES